MNYFNDIIRNYVKSTHVCRLSACEICNKIFFQTSRFPSYLAFCNIYQNQKMREGGVECGRKCA